MQVASIVIYNNSWCWKKYRKKLSHLMQVKYKANQVTHINVGTAMKNYMIEMSRASISACLLTPLCCNIQIDHISTSDVSYTRSTLGKYE